MKPDISSISAQKLTVLEHIARQRERIGSMAGTAPSAATSDSPTAGFPRSRTLRTFLNQGGAKGLIMSSLIAATSLRQADYSAVLKNILMQSLRRNTPTPTCPPADEANEQPPLR